MIIKAEVGVINQRLRLINHTKTLIVADNPYLDLDYSGYHKNQI